MLASIDEAITATMALYIEANKSLLNDSAYLSTKRELGIARSALEKAANLFITATNTLESALQTAEDIQKALDNASKLPIETRNGIIKDLNQHKGEQATRIALATGKVEKYCELLISQAHRVAQIAKATVEIENILASKIDGIQLYSIISQIPTMIREAITYTGGTSELAEKVALQLTNKLSDLRTLAPDDTLNSNIVEEQVVAMLESVGKL